jgi:hypothetical protein
VATIASPSTATTWAVGETIAFSGSGSDAEDGGLAASALNWSLVMHHCATPTDCHQHPVQTFNGVASGSFVAPDHEYPSYLELALTATDQSGATGSSSVLIQPKTVDLSFQTDPVGLELSVGSSSATAPISRTVIVGSTVSVAAPTPQTLDGVSYVFSSWSHGGPAAQDLVAPASDTTYTANFSEDSSPPPPSSGDGFVVMPGSAGGYVWSPDSDRLDVTGDIDMRVDVALDDWATNSGKFISKLGASYEFMLNGTTRGLRMAWYEQGGALRIRNSTASLPVAGGDRVQLRVALDVDNGSGGHTTTFYYRTDTSQPLTSHSGWTQLGDPVTVSGVSSIRSGGSNLVMGSHVNGNVEFWSGRFHRALIIDGVGAAGTVVANPDFTTTSQMVSTPPDYTTWRDTPGNIWTLTGNTSYTPGS